MKQVLIGGLMVLCGVTSVLAVPPVVSLRTARTIPTEEMEAYFPKEAWKVILDAPVSGYVVLRGSVGTDQRVEVTSTVASYPDQSRDKLAKRFAAQVRLVAPSVGSHLAPVADVFVLFYDTDAPVQQAVVFGRSRKGPMVRTTTNRDSYLEVIDYRKKSPSPGEGPVSPAAAETAGAAAPGTGQR